MITTSVEFTFGPEVPFLEVKRGQLFQHGLKLGDGSWAGLTTYVKLNKNSARPAFGQEHHVYGFDNPYQIVRIEVKA